MTTSFAPGLQSLPRGALLFALAQACLVLDGAAVHHLGPEVVPAQLTLLRAIGSLALFGLLLAARRERPSAALASERPGLQLLRGALTVVPLWLIFWGFARVPLAEATAITFTLPVWMAAFGALLLRERVSPGAWAALGLGLVGVLVVAGPRFAAWEPAYLALLAGVALNALGLVATRALGRRDRPVTIFGWVTLVGLALSLPGGVAAFPLPWAEQWPALLLVGVAGTGAVWCGLLALRAADLASLAPFGYLRLPIALALGLFVFGQVPQPGTLAGAALILLAGLLPLLSRPGTPRSPGAAPDG